MHLPDPTTEVRRIMGTWARRADAGLARSAARNAASSMHAQRSRELQDARTMHDLQRIPPADQRRDQAAAAAAGLAGD